MYTTHLKQNYTTFMFNNIFCEMNIKKVITMGEGRGEWGNHPNFFQEVLLRYLLGYPSILLGYPSIIHTFMPSIGF